MGQDLYEGNSIKTLAQSSPFGIDPYLPSPSLVKAVQLAQILQRPLLVKGEPGCGKSRLAEAIAVELHKQEFRNNYFTWNIKSTSKAQDGLYIIDNLQRLSDANFKEGQDLEIKLEEDKDGNFKPNGIYIKLGEMGKAFQLSNSPALLNPPVVLIDEIDKADIDFPNDLLLELDRMEFPIPEFKDKNGDPVKIKANKNDNNMRPLFIITSNDEKPLPPAFLRRCMFHFIDFKDINLQEIVESKFPDLIKEGSLVSNTVDVFKRWRKKIADMGTSNKNISTSELLDWVKLIDHYRKLETIEIEYKDDLLPLYHQALLKDIESIQLFAKKDIPVII